MLSLDCLARTFGGDDDKCSSSKGLSLELEEPVPRD